MNKTNALIISLVVVALMGLTYMEYGAKSDTATSTATSTVNVK